MLRHWLNNIKIPSLAILFIHATSAEYILFHKKYFREGTSNNQGNGGECVKKMGRKALNYYSYFCLRKLSLSYSYPIQITLHYKSVDWFLYDPNIT